MDIYRDPILNVRDAAAYLAIPESTLGAWGKERTIHVVAAERRGWPTLPFAAVVEAFVLRELRTEAGFSMAKVKEAAAGIRRAFDDPYGLIRPRIVYDAAEIFIDIAGDMYRAKDHNQVIRETVSNFKEFLTWSDEEPARLRLKQFGGSVIIDPRFGWGTPVVEANKVPIQSLLGLWYADEPIAVIADEFDMEAPEVERLIRAYDRGHRAA